MLFKRELWLQEPAPSHPRFSITQRGLVVEIFNIKVAFFRFSSSRDHPRASQAWCEQIGILHLLPRAPWAGQGEEIFVPSHSQVRPAQSSSDVVKPSLGITKLWNIWGEHLPPDPKACLSLHREQSQGKGFGNGQVGSARSESTQSPGVADQDFLHFPLEKKTSFAEIQAFSRVVLGSALYILNAKSNMQIRLKCSIFPWQELRISTFPFKIIFAMEITAWCNKVQ